MRAAAAFAMSEFDDGEARRIAEDLAGKYGSDALSFITARAERAVEIGDEIAQAIWHKVLTAASELLRR
jgi:fumarylacetoacetate (FAA) hydrolase family protein